MKIKRKLKPGQPGTKKLLEKFGDDLICVRYRYDATKKRRYKTVELIVDESAWEEKEAKIPQNQLTQIRVEYGEIELGRKVKARGGRWNKPKKVWELLYGDVVDLGLKDRIVNTDNKKITNIS